jgi:hypothetical protein
MESVTRAQTPWRGPFWGFVTGVGDSANFVLHRDRGPLCCDSW